MSPTSQPPTVAIIDYQMSNIFSVKHACDSLGIDAVVTSDPRVLAAADRAILPGVGAFGQAMEHLRDLDLVEPIRDFISSGRPFMGICLGLQLLFEGSEEFGSYQGLGVIPGTVVRFGSDPAYPTPRRVPHMGWARIAPGEGAAHWRESPLSGVPAGEQMYFVHSYYVVPRDPDLTLSTAEFEGIPFCSSIARDNIFASQFHPEKSAWWGISIFQNWASSPATT